VKKALAITAGVLGGVALLGAIFSFGAAAGGAVAAETGAAAAEVAAETAVDEAVTTFGDGFVTAVDGAGDAGAGAGDAGAGFGDAGAGAGEGAGEGGSGLPGDIPPEDTPLDLPPENNVPPETPPEIPPEDAPPEVPPENSAPPETPSEVPSEDDPFGNFGLDDEPITYEPGGGATGTRAERLGELAKDPAHGGEVTAGSQREAEVGLNLEERGELPGPISREASGEAEFVDGKGQAWDVKGFHSEGGRFDIEYSMSKIEREIALNRNVILDGQNLSQADIASLRAAIDEAGLTDKIIWYFD
jgi:hypothetical protein